MVAGYFDPDYRNISPKSNYEEIISSMLKNHDKILGGVILVPFVKFGLFDTDLDATLTKVEEQIIRVHEHLEKWKNFLSKTNRQVHSIRISHTDQGILTIAFQIKFSKPISLEKTSLCEELFTTLNFLQKSNLL